MSNIHVCDECGEEFDEEDEVEADFAVFTDDGQICALCNSEQAD